MPILKLRRGVRGRACMRKRVRDDSQLARRGGEGSRVCILSKTELFVLRCIMLHGTWGRVLWLSVTT